ncbi:DinB family protein [Falsibacillus pallidus]|uniref:Putative damage-inducible protein DinB n=1 Tax=Falsibacillus pallidus TaxID=493781 RepID=A0A370GVQ6_9BACI|nr:DinB family protein [Falsibacillus pallidus]RDI47747.1 putative damage-inducible protein DinB [Falsibacillus pallidus]
MNKEELERIRQKLLDSFITLNKGDINTKPGHEKWSISQVVLHVAGAETRFMHAAFQGLKENKKTNPADVDLSVFDDPSKKLKAPIEPPEEWKGKDELVEVLKNSREMTFEFLDKYKESDLSGISLNHHRFGEMPIWQIFELVGKHENRHIHQVEDIKKQLGL